MPIGELAAFGNAVLGAATLSLFTYVSDRIGVFTQNLLRLLAGTVILGIIHYLYTGQIFESYENQRQLYYLIISGIVGYSIGDIFLFRSNVMLGPRLGTLVFMSYVPMATIMAVPALNEKLGFQAFFGMVITLIGITMVVMAQKGSLSKFQPKNLPLGILFGLIGAFCNAFGLVLSKLGMIGNSATVMNASFVRLVAATATIWLTGFMLGRNKHVLKSVYDIKLLGIIIIGSFIGPYLSVWFALIAMRHTYTGIATTIMALTPVIIIPMAQITHKERITPQIILGTITAIAGAALLFI
ncbi:MAG: DMT family transporter [Deltaproteobacteria bacterium]|nr:DMT family transporter [Deltaproteobacteria bacterium]MBI2974538.1 DMT family transporter [Deltaproteobacteria bacterium]